MDSYDIGAGSFDIARKLLDPEDVLPQSDDDDDIPDLPNYFGNIRVLFRTLLDGKLITPAGDPVNSPSDAGDGANEFTFSPAAPGVLTIHLKAKPGDGVALEVDTARKFKFELDEIPGSTLTWSTNNEDGRAKKEGAFMVATATFTGLPANNSAFGKKNARLMAEGLQCDSKQYEVFFPKNISETEFVKNHPGEGSGTTPNWYYYWLQTSANKTNTTTSYGGPGRSTYSFDAKEDKEGAKTIFLRDDSAEIQSAWGHPRGIDCFAWTSAHEAKHHSQMTAFWPSGRVLALDGDRDWIPDSLEETYMPGHVYDIENIATFPDTVGYGTSPIPDREDIAMRSQTPAADGSYPVDQLWVNGTANSADWANPGKNSKSHY